MLHPLAFAIALSGMVRIPAGDYTPLYATAHGRTTHVAAFALDVEPATRGQYLAFVRANPVWRRSATSPTLAERSYLADWRGDLDAGDAADLRRPVTGVSWLAAKAYC